MKKKMKEKLVNIFLNEENFEKKIND